MNKVILIGNLTRDPEIGQTNSGLNYCRFTIAVQRRFANADGERETDFFNCVAWRQTAEFVGKYFAKGNRISVCGSIQNRSYEDSKGERKYITDIIVDEAEFAGSKNSDGEKTVKKEQPTLEPIDDDGDLPF